ncbi:MAG: 50S ribosomal protein L25 [Saprospiraceae bacterium]|nr:50S ribosomal protein L25 [Saprospiraceae bacterium]
MKTITLEGTLRTDLGKKSTKALRNASFVPCVVYGSGENVHFSTPAQSFRDLIYTNEYRIAEINIDGKTIKAIVKAIQFHPVNDKIMHVDLLELVDGKSFKTEIPINLVGQPEGVKVGGILMQKIRKVKVKTTPENLTASIDVDVAHLVLGKSIRIREIQVPEGVEIMNAGGIPLASVEVPRALRSSTAKEEEEEGVEGTEEEGVETTEEKVTEG